jgi:DNA-binding PadR family transcriptional regulator
MSMKHAVLGLLVQRPGYAYELAQRFRREVGWAWELNTSHIYSLLEQLETEALVVARPRVRERKHYFPTADGRREFESWLTSEPGRVRIREETYLRIAVSTPRHYDTLIEVLSLQERATLELWERLSAECSLEEALEPPIDWRKTASQLIADGQIARAEADLAWLRRTRETLAWLKTQDVRWTETGSRGQEDGEPA